MNIKKIIIFLVIVLSFLFLFRSCSLMSPFWDFGINDDVFKLEDKINKVGEKKEIPIPVFNIIFPPATPEMKNIKIDCTKESLIPATYRKEKMLCQNIYTADLEAIKNNLEKYSRIVFYGRELIYSCPAHPEREIENLVEGCWETARFLDSHQLDKMAKIFGTGMPTKKLFMYVEESREKVSKACKMEASGCYLDGPRYILVPLDPYNTKRYYPEKPIYRVGGVKGASSENAAYYFFETLPKNCIMTDVSLHELTHYFNHDVYGETPPWFEESIAYLLHEKLIKEICPPGARYDQAKKVENGKWRDIPDFSGSNNEYILFVQSKRFEDNICRKAIITQINNLMKEEGWGYFRKLYKALSTKVQYDYYHEISTDRLAAAVLESTNNNLETKEYLYNDSKCPK